METKLSNEQQQDMLLEDYNTIYNEPISLPFKQTTHSENKNKLVTYHSINFYNPTSSPSSISTLEQPSRSKHGIVVWPDEYLSPARINETLERRSVTQMDFTAAIATPVTSCQCGLNFFYAARHRKDVVVWLMFQQAKFASFTITLTGHRNAVKALKIIPSTTQDIEGICSLYIFVLSGSGDKRGSIKLWKISPAKREWTCWATLQGHTNSVHAVDGVINGKDATMTIYSGSGDTNIKIWNVNLTKINTFECTHTLDHHTKQITSIDLANLLDMKLLVTSSNDGTVKIFDRKTFSLLASLDHNGPARSLKCCSNPKKKINEI